MRSINISTFNTKGQSNDEGPVLNDFDFQMCSKVLEFGS